MAEWNRTGRNGPMPDVRGRNRLWVLHLLGVISAAVKEMDEEYDRLTSEGS